MEINLIQMMETSMTSSNNMDKIYKNTTGSLQELKPNY